MLLDLFECVATPRTSWFFVRVEATDGTVGYGECSDAGSAREIDALLPGAAQAFCVVDDEDLDDDVIARAARNATRDDGLACRTVVGGVEQAACDIAARRRGLPLWKWLGGDGGQAVPVYANINRFVGGRSPGDVAEAGVRAVGDGFTAVKCAPFDAPLTGMSIPQAGLARVAALRAAVGQGIDLMVDCHERVAPADLQPLLPAIAALDVSWLEDAVPVSDLTGLRAIRAATAMRIAGGELAADAEDVAPAVEQGLLDVVMPDVKHAGGILRAAALAAAVDVEVSPHNPSGPIATAASAHLFAAVPRARVLEFAYGEVDWRSELVRGGETIRDGQLAVPSGAGLGIDLDTTNHRLRHVRAITV